MLKWAVCFTFIVFITEFYYVSCNVINDEKFNVMNGLDKLFINPVKDVPIQVQYDPVFYYQPEQVHISFGGMYYYILIFYSFKTTFILYYIFLNLF